MQVKKVVFSIHTLVMVFLFFSILSCAVPIKVDVDKAQLIPREQAYAFLKTIKLEKDYAEFQYKDLYLDYVQWTDTVRLPYKDLEVVVKSFMGDYHVILYVRDETKFIGNNACFVYIFDPPIDDYSKKVINALVSLGADLKKVE